MYLSMYKHTNIHTYIHTYIHVCIYIYIYTYIHIYIYTHIYLCTCEGGEASCQHLWGEDMGLPGCFNFPHDLSRL